MTAICHLRCGAVVSVAVHAQEGANDRSHVPCIPRCRVLLDLFLRLPRPLSSVGPVQYPSLINGIHSWSDRLLVRKA